jgi:cyclase
MLLRRVIACLDVKDGRVVKGTRFVDLQDQGDPAELAARYAADGADEIVFLDITAAPEQRGTLLDVVNRTAARSFVPLTVGGGVRSEAEMKAVLRAGADKVAVNTSAVLEPSLIKRCARRFGRQCVVVAVDAKRWPGHRGSWEVLVRGGRDRTGLDVILWAQRAEQMGAGEILLTSIDADGTNRGYDVELLRAVSRSVEIPVVASGGAGQPSHFVDAVVGGGADAVLAAGIFHRREFTIGDVKTAMADAGVPVRMVVGAA